MTKRPRPTSNLAQLVDPLRIDLDALTTAAAAQPPSTGTRRQLEQQIQELVTRMDGLLRDLDPVRQPRVMFDPGNPAVVGRVIALAMIAQPRAPLLQVERFYGSGIYALYYKGEHEAYRAISGTETPIYVGKVDPATDNAKRPKDQGERLSGRLRDHQRSIRKAAASLRVEDFDYRSIVVQTGWQDAAENYLIRMFKPIWNDETGICYGLGKHGDDPGTRKNLRSPWDTLHHGRDWAHRDPEMADAKAAEIILAEIAAHFGHSTIFRSLDDVLESFVTELRQL
jgi:hypothetical protein